MNELALEERDALQAILIQQYGSDPNAKDRARVLRVPGFYHLKKRASRWQVKLLKSTRKPPYSVAQMLDAFPLLFDSQKKPPC